MGTKIYSMDFNRIKKQIYIITFFVFIPFWIFGQNRFSTGLNLSSDLSFMNINSSKLRGPMEESGGIGFGYSLGFQVQYKLNQKLFLRSGLNYQNLNHRHNISGLKFETDLINGTESSLKNVITISSIGIPLDLGLKVGSNSEELSFLIGIRALININLKNKSKVKALHRQLENEDLSMIENQVDASLFSLGLFAGVELEISDKLILGIEPYLRYTPNKFIFYVNIFDSKVDTALETGLTIRLRRK